MAKFLALIKYTPDGCAVIAKEGLSSRRAALEAASEAQGGRLEAFWAVDSVDWNVAFVLDSPDDQVAADRVAMFVVTYGLGHIENSVFLPLTAPEDADAAMQKFTAVRAPGE